MPSRCVIYMSVSLSRGTFNITCINCIEVEPYFLFLSANAKYLILIRKKVCVIFWRLLINYDIKKNIEQVFTDITLHFHLR